MQAGLLPVDRQGLRTAGHKQCGGASAGASSPPVLSNLQPLLLGCHPHRHPCCSLCTLQRHRICRLHQKAATIDIEGEPWRFCQQVSTRCGLSSCRMPLRLPPFASVVPVPALTHPCLPARLPACFPACAQCAKLQPMPAFESDKRSCQESLQHQKERRQRQQAQLAQRSQQQQPQQQGESGDAGLEWGLKKQQLEAVEPVQQQQQKRRRTTPAPPAPLQQPPDR